MRALEREIGEERAHAIVGRAIAESHAEWRAKAVSTRNSHPRDNDIEEQLPIKTEVVEDADSTCAINMTRCGFAEYVRAIGAAGVGARLTRYKAGVTATGAVFAGDSVWDVEPARRAGVACIGVLSGGISRGALEDAGAAAVFDNTKTCWPDSPTARS